MLRNYFTTIFRSLKAGKVNAVINIIGLSISIACCIFIYVFIKHEKSFDDFHSKADRIYRVVFDVKKAGQEEHNGAVSFPVARALRNDFPQLENVTQVYVNNAAIISIPVKEGTDKLFEDDQLTYADEYFLQTFDFKKIAGSGKLLAQPDEVVLTKKLADKFFDTRSQEDYAAVIGKIITVNKNNYRVSAVLEDFPRNSNLACHMLLPFKVFEKNNPAVMQNWKNLFSESYAFITLPENYPVEKMNAALAGFKDKYLDKEDARQSTYHIQPLLKVHTEEKYGGTYYATPSILILAFIIMGIIVLITSCINFINLATVQSLKRAKEVGIRKTLGSSRRALVFRFMGETMILIVIASAIALLLANYFLGAFNQYLSFIVELDLHIDKTILLFLAALILLITFLAGYYPARLMASFNPVHALKHTIKAKNTGFANRFSLRKTLVVTQFVVSQLLIIGTIVVATQMKFFRNHDMGYQKEGILTVQIPENDEQKIALFRNELAATSQVKDASFNSGPPTSASNGFSDIRRKEAPRTNAINSERKFVDAHYLSTFKIKLLAGRNLTESDKVFLSDSLGNYNVLLNKKAILSLGYKTPEEALGGQINVNDKTTATIIGVTDDFFNVSLQGEVLPCLMFYGTNWITMAAINMRDIDSKNTLAAIEKKWSKIFPGYIYKSATLDYYMDHEAFYVIEDVMYQGFKIFVVLSLLIGCMGLYGLVAFLALQRQKEIGVRKVLGASVNSIVLLFSKEFVMLVLFSFLIAAPLGYFAMQSWLQTFANRIDLSAGYFIATLLISMLIAGFTVGFQAVKAAVANPVRSLKSE